MHNGHSESEVCVQLFELSVSSNLHWTAKPIQTSPPRTRANHEVADQPSVLHVTESAPPLSPNANAERMARLPPKHKLRIYDHDLIYKHIDRHRLFKLPRGEGSNDSPQTYQKQYRTHWAHMTIEKWAIPIFTAAGFKEATTTATKRS